MDLKQSVIKKLEQLSVDDLVLIYKELDLLLPEDQSIETLVNNLSDSDLRQNGYNKVRILPVNINKGITEIVEELSLNTTNDNYKHYLNMLTHPNPVPDDILKNYLHEEGTTYAGTPSIDSIEKKLDHFGNLKMLIHKLGFTGTLDEFKEIEHLFSMFDLLYRRKLLLDYITSNGGKVTSFGIRYIESVNDNITRLEEKVCKYYSKIIK